MEEVQALSEENFVQSVSAGEWKSKLSQSVALYSRQCAGCSTRMKVNSLQQPSPCGG